MPTNPFVRAPPAAAGVPSQFGAAGTQPRKASPFRFPTSSRLDHPNQAGASASAAAQRGTSSPPGAAGSPASYQQAYLHVSPAVEGQRAERRRREKAEAAAAAAELRRAERPRVRASLFQEQERQRLWRRAQDDAERMRPRNSRQEYVYGQDFEACAQGEEGAARDACNGRPTHGSSSGAYGDQRPHRRSTPSGRRGFDESNPDDHWGWGEGGMSPDLGAAWGSNWASGPNGSEAAFSDGGGSFGSAGDGAHDPLHPEYWEDWFSFQARGGGRPHAPAGGFYCFYGNQQRQRQEQREQRRAPEAGEAAAREAAQGVHAAEQRAAAAPAGQSTEAEAEAEALVARAVQGAAGNITAFATALGVAGPASGGDRAARNALLLRYHPDRLQAATLAEQLLGQHVTRALNSMAATKK